MSDSVRRHRWQPTRLRRPWDSPGKNTGVGCHFLLQCMKVKREREAAQSCPTLSNPKDCSPPGSSVHGIFQARVLEWVAIAFSNTAKDVGSILDWGTKIPEVEQCGQKKKRLPSFPLGILLGGALPWGQSTEKVPYSFLHSFSSLEETVAPSSLCESLLRSSVHSSSDSVDFLCFQSQNNLPGQNSVCPHFIPRVSPPWLPFVSWDVTAFSTWQSGG